MRSAISAVIGRSNKYARMLAQVHAKGNMIAKIELKRGGDAAPVWNPVTNQVESPEGEVIWGPDPADPTKGIARIYAVTGPVTMGLGDEPQYFQSTYISIPLEAPLPEIDDVVEVIEHPDIKLVGRFYRVVDVERGGQIPVVHKMQVVGVEPSRSWRPPA